MRFILITGLLVSVPTAALLALATWALLISYLRRRLRRALNRRFQRHAGTIPPEVPLAERHDRTQVSCDAPPNISFDVPRPYCEVVPAQVKVLGEERVGR
jgi:hypothetical protein